MYQNKSGDLNRNTYPSYLLPILVFKDADLSLSLKKYEMEIGEHVVLLDIEKGERLES